MLPFMLFSICFSQPLSEIAIYGSVETLGYYFIELYIGTPASRQTVVIDTGSSLTAFPCLGCKTCGEHIDSYYDYKSSSTFKKLSCESSLCSSCINNECEYYLSYTEGSSISGILAEDFMSFSPAHEAGVPVRAVFGCHQKETKLFISQSANGIMGLSTETSLIDAMYEAGQIEKNAFSLCLGLFGGKMTVGNYNESQSINWTKTYDDFYYDLKLKNLIIDSEKIEMLNDRGQNSFTMVDSGTTFSYLSLDIYSRFFSAFKKYCKKEKSCKAKRKKVHGEPEECFVYDRSLTKEDFFLNFPVIILDFDDTQLSWLPENYLFAWPEEPDYYCIGIYSHYSSRNVLGATFMRGNEVTFDRSLKRIGFEKKNCENSDKKHDFFVLKKSNWFRNLPVFGIAAFLVSAIGVVYLFIWVKIKIREKHKILKQ